MIRRYSLILCSFLVGLLAVGFVLAQAEPEVSEGGETAVLPDGANLFISRTYHNGLLNTSHQGIFGPAICTRWGDPFSPRFSQFETPKPRNADGTYSYTYRIKKDYDDVQNHDCRGLCSD